MDIIYKAEVIKPMSTKFGVGDIVSYRVFNNRGDFELTSEDKSKKEVFGFAYKSCLKMGELLKRTLAPRSEYTGLHKIKNNGRHKWHVKYTDGNGELIQIGIYELEEEREAAIAYDKMMIKLGKDPVNILKKK